MTRTSFIARFTCIAVATSLTLAAAQRGNDPVSSASGLPVWSYSADTAIDGTTHMVGASPLFHGHGSTSISTYLIPLVVTLSNGSVFDSTRPAACAATSDSAVDLIDKSPVFQSAPFIAADTLGGNASDLGFTQYADAFQRGNFLKYLTPSPDTVLPYHTLLAASILPAVHVAVPARNGFASDASARSACPFASVDYDWLRDNLIHKVLPSLAAQGVVPAALPVFILSNVVMYPNGNPALCPGKACLEGRHGAYATASGAQQTYIVANFDTTGQFEPDVAALSREIAEWMVDPYGQGETSAQKDSAFSACASAVEASRPDINGQFSFVAPDGFTYHPTEILFSSGAAATSLCQSPAPAESLRVLNASPQEQ